MKHVVKTRDCVFVLTSSSPYVQGMWNVSNVIITYHSSLLLSSRFFCVLQQNRARSRLLYLFIDFCWFTAYSWKYLEVEERRGRCCCFFLSFCMQKLLSSHQIRKETAEQKTISDFLKGVKWEKTIVDYHVQSVWLHVSQW